MKNIKTYNEFGKINESRYSDFKEIMDTLGDYISEIKMDYLDDDAGLNIKVYPDNDIGIRIRSLNVPTSDSEPFSINIQVAGHAYARFETTKLVPSITSICSYMYEMGYKTYIESRACTYNDNREYGDFGKDISIGVNDGNLNDRFNNIDKCRSVKLTFEKINKEYPDLF
jgi:hypothetical protein